MTRYRQFAVLLVAGLLALGGPAAAQDIGAKLSAARLGEIEPGLYRAADRIDFTLMKQGGNYLLKFADDPEIFLLSADRSSLGGRILKYDTGAMALQVSGLGSLTLYPEDAPNGLPAARVDDAPALMPETVSLQQIQAAADETGKRLNIIVAADWAAFAADAATRSFGLEALRNFEAGALRFIKQHGRAAFTGRVDTLRLEPNLSRSLLLAGKTLALGFRPEQYFSGRLSSRAVAATLNTLLTGSSAASAAPPLSRAAR